MVAFMFVVECRNYSLNLVLSELISRQSFTKGSDTGTSMWNSLLHMYQQQLEKCLKMDELYSQWLCNLFINGYPDLDVGQNQLNCAIQSIPEV